MLSFSLDHMAKPATPAPGVPTAGLPFDVAPATPSQPGPFDALVREQLDGPTAADLLRADDAAADAASRPAARYDVPSTSTGSDSPAHDSPSRVRRVNTDDSRPADNAPAKPKTQAAAATEAPSADQNQPPAKPPKPADTNSSGNGAASGDQSQGSVDVQALRQAANAAATAAQQAKQAGKPPAGAEGADALAKLKAVTDGAVGATGAEDASKASAGGDLAALLAQLKTRAAAGAAIEAATGASDKIKLTSAAADAIKTAQQPDTLDALTRVVDGNGAATTGGGAQGEAQSGASGEGLPKFGADPALTAPKIAAAFGALLGTTSLVSGTAALESAAPTSTALALEQDGASITSQIVQAMRLQALNGGGTAELTLQPHYLGDVTVSIHVDQDRVTASVLADSPAVRDWLQTNEASLRQGLSDQGLRLDRLDVGAPPETPRREADARQSSSQSASRDGRQPPRPKRHAGDQQPAFDVLV